MSEEAKEYNKKFKEELVKSSSVNNFENACKEWKLLHISTSQEILENVDYDDDDSVINFKCICGKNISKLVYIKNTKNNKELLIGRCCFLNMMITYNKELFDELKKILQSEKDVKKKDRLKITFGKKYKGKTYNEVYKDKHYVRYIKDQSQFSNNKVLDFFVYITEKEFIEKQNNDMNVAIIKNKIMNTNLKEALDENKDYNIAKKVKSKFNLNVSE